jgi:lipopolysaccharide transport system permease protein
MAAEETVIEAGRAEGQYWRDLWRYRELFYFLAWRDLLTRYKQTAFGIAWAVVRPLLTTAILTFAFSRIAGLSSGAVPYALFVFAAQVPWQFFANALNDSSTSLIGNAQLVTKVYFPRIIIPGSSLLPAVVDLLVTLVILAGLMAWYAFVPSWHVVFLPGFVVLALLSAMGLGLWMSAFTVKYRDFRFITGFVLQFGVYVSPVGFDSRIVPEQWRTVFALNPMVGVIDGFRWSLFGGDAPFPLREIGASAAVGLLLLFTGIRHFRRVERGFADVI